MPRKRQSSQKGAAILAAHRHDLGIEIVGALSLALLRLRISGWPEGTARLRLRLNGRSVGSRSLQWELESPRVMADIWGSVLAEAARRPRGAIGRLLARGSIHVRIDLLNGTGEALKSAGENAYVNR